MLRLLMGVLGAVPGGSGGDTPPWSLPGADINIGIASALAQILVRFAVTSGVNSGTLNYQLSGGSTTQFEAGTYHEDEPNAISLNQFEVRATHLAGLILDFGSRKMDVWYTLIPIVIYNQANLTAGNYTSTTRFEIREISVPAVILASGEYTLAWTVV